MLVAGRRVKLGVVAAGTAMLLAGCALNPGAAAQVGSDTISHEQVDDVAQAFCAANVATAKAGNQAMPPLASRRTREAALQLLLEADLMKQFGEHEGVQANQQQVSQELAKNDAGFALLPENEREHLRDAFQSYIEGRLMLIEAGRKSLGPGAGDDQAMAEGSRLLKEYVDGLDVEVDPRYGRFQNGAFKRGGTELSVAASDTAKAGLKANPNAAFLGNLPASQLCH